MSSFDDFILPDRYEDIVSGGSLPETVKPLLGGTRVLDPLDAFIPASVWKMSKTLGDLDTEAVQIGRVAIYENEVLVQRAGPKKRAGGGVRGKILGYSDASRLRFIGKLNRLRWPCGKALFLTLTYPDEFEPDPIEVKRDLALLRKRLLRRYTGIGVIWRQEWKARKSGKNVGQVASHFHALVFNVPDELEFLNFVSSRWAELVGMSQIEDHLEHGTDVKVVSSRRHAQFYVSKYMTKTDAVAIQNNQVVDSESGEIATRFPGRPWGVFGELDFRPIEILHLAIRELHIFRRYVVNLLKSRGSVRFARRLTHYPAWSGFRVFGLGSETSETLDKLLALVGKSPQWRRQLQQPKVYVQYLGV